MRELVFDVDGQRLRKNRNCNFSNIVKGTSGYLELVFNFSPEWDGLKKVISFTYGGKTQNELLPDGNHVLLTETVTQNDSFFITIYGANESMKLVTNEIKIRQS